MRSLYRIEFIYLIKELKILEGQILDNVYKFRDIYRIKFRKNSINLQVPYRINLTYIQYPNDTPDQVVLRLRNYCGRKLEKIDLVDMDRLIKMEFQDGLNLYLEFFGKGNILIESKEERFYTNYPSPGKTKPFNSNWNIENIEKYIATAFGKIYIDYLKDKVKGDPIIDLENIKAELAPYKCIEGFRVLPGPNCEKHSSLSYLIDKFYELKPELTSEKYQKLLSSKQKLLNEIAIIEKELEENKIIAKKIMDNYEYVQDIIDKNKGKGKIYIDL